MRVLVWPSVCLATKCMLVWTFCPACTSPSSMSVLTDFLCTAVVSYAHFISLLITKLFCMKRCMRREIITVRGQSYVSRLPKYWPPTPLSARVYVRLTGVRPKKQGTGSSFLTWSLHVRESRRRTRPSAGPERSQKLQILPSLNSKAILQRVRLLFLLRQHWRAHSFSCAPTLAGA